jgi:uncharacterized protein
LLPFAPILEISLVLTVNVATLREGQSKFEADVTVEEADLIDVKEFAHPIHVLHDFNKVGDEVFIKTSLTTQVELTCDVCLEDFKLDVNERIEIILTKDKDLVEREEEDVYLVSDSTTKVDITDSVRQSLLLAVPFKRVCREDCKGLCATCGTNLNHHQCSCTNEKIDPRWAGLKNITFDND